MAVTKAQKRRIKQEAGFKCAVPTCSHTSPLEIHHIIHKHNGGTDTDDNLVCLCGGCHGRYHLGEITEQAIIDYKHRLRRISIVLAAHEHGYLEAL
jgi:5-methylcytosine-specific restriction endonuclease McrA